MAVRGGGPSRRSHTKSRKGCKTCKRRHIRCDENFPQCRNCIKHHVRCDYMDMTAPDVDTITNASSENASPVPLALSPDHYAPTVLRSDTGYSELGLVLAPGAQPTLLADQYGPDSELLHNLYAVCDGLDAKGASDLTIWIPFFRRHLSICGPQFPYLVDALKAFSAGQISWHSGAPTARDQAVRYSTSALAGLHRAVGSFSKANSDAVFATSAVLCSQSKDWLSWSSLMGGVASITAAISTWEHDSIYSDLIRRTNQIVTPQEDPGPDLDASQRSQLLKRLQMALQQLRSHLGGRVLEAHWVDQLLDLVYRLHNTEPARTAEEQFNHLYVLRKWVFWVPVHILQDGPVDTLKLAVIAHLYAFSLALCPMYNLVGRAMIADVTAPTLANILHRIQAAQSQLGYFDLADATALMQFPQAAFNEYTIISPVLNHTVNNPRAPIPIPSSSPYLVNNTDHPGNLSPAFTPAAFDGPHARASSDGPAFLTVPPPPTPPSLQQQPQHLSPHSHQQHYVDHSGFSQNTSHWGTYPSPSFPAQDVLVADDDFPLSDSPQARSMTEQFGGYIQPCEIWT